MRTRTADLQQAAPLESGSASRGGVRGCRTRFAPPDSEPHPTVEDDDAIRAILEALAASAELLGRAPPPVAALNASQAAAIGV